jgi:hypothetical protein
MVSATVDPIAPMATRPTRQMERTRIITDRLSILPRSARIRVKSSTLQASGHTHLGFSTREAGL